MRENKNPSYWDKINSIILILILIGIARFSYLDNQTTKLQLELINSNSEKISELSDKIDSLLTRIDSASALRLYGIQGYVVDENSEPISYATLIIEGDDVETSIDGKYTYLSSFTENQVEIVVQKDGYETTHEGIKLLANQMNEIRHVLEKTEVVIE